MSMTNEEKYLRERVGQKNHFRTPDGYFDQFATRMMAQLPEQQPVARKVSIAVRRWLYAAACVAVLVVVGLSFHFNQQQSAEQTQQMAVSDSYIEEAADYAMLDNADIYQLLAEE